MSEIGLSHIGETPHAVRRLIDARQESPESETALSQPYETRRQCFRLIHVRLARRGLSSGSAECGGGDEAGESESTANGWRVEPEPHGEEKVDRGDRDGERLNGADLLHEAVVVERQD